MIDDIDVLNLNVKAYAIKQQVKMCLTSASVLITTTQNILKNENILVLPSNLNKIHQVHVETLNICKIIQLNIDV